METPHEFEIRTFCVISKARQNNLAMRTSCISAMYVVSSSGPTTPHTLRLADATCVDKNERQIRMSTQGGTPTYSLASDDDDDAEEEEACRETPTTDGRGYLTVFGFLPERSIP